VNLCLEAKGAFMVVAVLLVLALLAAVGAGAWCWVLVRRWRAEQAEVRRVKETFARYVPRSIVVELLNRKDEDIYAGREMRATILVCRIWNFTQLMDRHSPQETLRYLNEFYAMAGASIERQRGTLHRFLDDGVVGVFGVPLEDAQQEDHALRAAINIVRLVTLMRDKWIGSNRTPLRVGVGVNSGQVIAGDAGFAQRREYTVVGSAVAFAHRLANATSDLNASIVAARETVEPVRELYDLVPVPGVPIAGQRALLDASIIRGRKRSDDLTLPRARTFANTVLDVHEIPDFAAAPELEPIVEAAAFGLAEPPAAPPPPAPPPRPKSPPLRTRPIPHLPFGHSERRGFDLPELRMPLAFNHQDEGPIMPDPPPPRATYEDRGGPPHPLL
jgi:class 3 adenylate cyclase